MFHNPKPATGDAEPSEERPTLAGHLIGGRRAAETHRKQADAFLDIFRPIITRLYGQGLSLRDTANELERLGIRPRRGKRWSAAQVRRALLRAGLVAAKPNATPPVAEAEAVSLPALEQEPSPEGVMISIRGKITGPHTLAEVAAMFGRGEITLVTPCRRNVSGAKWMPLVTLDLAAVQAVGKK